MLRLAILHRAALRLVRPLRQGLVAEFAHRFDHERLHFVRRAKGRARIALRGDSEDGFKLREHLRARLELLVEFLEPSLRARFLQRGFGLLFDVVFLLHRHVHLYTFPQSTI